MNIKYRCHHRAAAALIACFAVLCFARASVAEIYDFSGAQNLQGWAVLNGVANFRTGDGGGMGPANPGNTDYAHDNAHVTFLVESPAFTFWNGLQPADNALIWITSGGAGDQANDGPAFANPAAVLAYNAGNSNEFGEKGLALLNTASGQYDAVLFKQGNGGIDTNRVSASDLTAAGVNLAQTYKLQYYENDQVGWGWGQLNRVETGTAEPIVIPPGPKLFDPLTGHLLQSAATDFGVATWAEHHAEAVSRGAHLATPRSDVESLNISRVGGNAWIGLTDQDVEGDWRLLPDVEDPAGTLIWRGLAGGTAVGGNFTKWNGGEPNDSGGEDFAEVTPVWNDLTATHTRNGVYEYDTPTTNTARWTVRQVRPVAGVLVNSLADSDALFDGTSPTSVDVSQEFVAVNFSGDNNQGDFRPATGYVDSDWLAGGGDDFAVRATANVEIPVTGEYMFRIHHDDHSRITINDLNGNEIAMQETAGCCGNNDLTIMLNAGTVEVIGQFYERGGGDYFELSASGPTTGGLKLIGDTAADGLRVVDSFVIPEPSSMVLGLLAIVGLAGCRWRRRG
jgi:hypothetical protein